MCDYFNTINSILVPFKPVLIKFHEKEEVELNAFQNFILESVENNATIEQIVNATQLTKNVIETEILQMEGQKLLVRNKNIIELSDLSKNILLISRSVIALNNEKKIVGVNLITGDIEGYNINEYCKIENNDLKILPKILPNDVVGIDIEDNMSFFSNYMNTFDNLSEDQIDKILSSIYVELYDVDEKIVYKKYTIYKLPCLIGNNNSENIENSRSIYAEGRYSIITLNVSTERIEKYKVQLHNIETIYKMFPEIISDTGKMLLDENAICENYNKGDNIFLYDHISGNFLAEKYKTLDNVNKRTQLTLKPLIKLDEEIQNQIIKKAIIDWNLDKKYQVKVSNIREETYKVKFLLEDIWSKDYENE